MTGFGLSGDWLGNSRSMVLTHDDGAVTADHFPIRLVMSRCLLEEPVDKLLSRRFRNITIRLANGLAVYRIVARWPSERTYGLKRVYLEQADPYGWR